MHEHWDLQSPVLSLLDDLPAPEGAGPADLGVLTQADAFRFDGSCAEPARDEGPVDPPSNVIPFRPRPVAPAPARETGR